MGRTLHTRTKRQVKIVSASAEQVVADLVNAFLASLPEAAANAAELRFATTPLGGDYVEYAVLIDYEVAP